MVRINYFRTQESSQKLATIKRGFVQENVEFQLKKISNLYGILTCFILILSLQFCSRLKNQPGIMVKTSSLAAINVKFL